MRHPLADLTPTFGLRQGKPKTLQSRQIVNTPNYGKLLLRILRTKILKRIKLNRFNLFKASNWFIQRKTQVVRRQRESQIHM
jgi:hypothetical protein